MKKEPRPAGPCLGTTSRPAHGSLSDKSFGGQTTGGLTRRHVRDGQRARILPATSLNSHAHADLFIAFALIALCGFGGVLAWSRRMLVEERKWMTAQEFDDAYALCQFLPGPNVVNLSVVFGRRIRGTLGAA